MPEDDRLSPRSPNLLQRTTAVVLPSTSPSSLPPTTTHAAAEGEPKEQFLKAIAHIVLNQNAVVQQFALLLRDAVGSAANLVLARVRTLMNEEGVLSLPTTRRVELTASLPLCGG